MSESKESEPEFNPHTHGEPGGRSACTHSHAGATATHWHSYGQPNLDYDRLTHVYSDPSPTDSVKPAEGSSETYPYTGEPRDEASEHGPVRTEWEWRVRT
jgi:hypothetical protein